jgi:hypothetical protein
VIEIDPLSREIVWEYHAPQPTDFYTRTRGSSQRLANGNTLIAQSESGRAFEVTRDGDIVWDFVNPNLVEGHRPTIIRMRRIDAAEIERIERLARDGALR